MKIKERIITNEAEAKKFIEEQTRAIKQQVGNHKAICFCSGGVDSTAVAILGQRALEDGVFRSVFVENGLMRLFEIPDVAASLVAVGIRGKVVDAKNRFFSALAGKISPYEKRKAIRETFYNKILPEVAHEFGAEFLLQGTNLTDVEATVLESAAPQHNILSQIGIVVGLEVIEPLAELRKPSVRLVAKALGLPESIWNRMPFPGPALAARIVGEVTREKVEIIRKVTAIVEKELHWTCAFQYLAVLVSDMVPNHDRTKLGYAVVIECIDSTSAVTAMPTVIVPGDVRSVIRENIYRSVPEIFKIAWDFSTKPPAAIEWV